VVVLGAASEGKVSLIVGVTKDLTGGCRRGRLWALLAAMVGGKGGGRPDLAEAGGSDVGRWMGAGEGGGGGGGLLG
jgi:alanyl-tRNA synthetase